MTSDAQIRAFIDRILRLKEEQDTIGEDIRDIYAEAKSMGFDKTAMGNVVAHLRKVAKKGHDTVAEQGAIFDLYLCAYEGKSPHAPAPARVRENIEQFDPTTGEIIEADVSAKLVETIAAGVQTEVGRAALIAAVDIMIAREDAEDHEALAGTAPAVETSLAAREAEESAVSNSEIASAAQGETESPSAEAEAAGANAGGEDVDGSAERARNAATNVANAAESVTAGETATNSIAKPKYVLRPHCLNPGEACGGYSDKHCHTCTVAMRKREQTEEVA
ncbi:DUF2312 domain-containing protein [Sinorhizobium meliloti]|uniref:DUF2312 domain-containing protein n=1 Tax=Rhizobium meliloti TaxID=382 RepID=UPI000286145C|nr:GapR family DNA-binding domain-containing protein [Sinorhizobium meliloti]ASP77434.1 DUF2312 domain-containing protein [Sinorhizobium meliloti]MQW16822.1 DUF2312 domain-containing protein [Sinorhizobium meliloti]QND27155.1 DUF2312 domain-containing protein [Sinorhizobium meliloti]RVH27865.1 DUF2312 domain-containing protein [Sinorhizobium meliloti]RVO33114.1 DUF2312 domain-containing protein [Sinorhizobium meliloti]